MSLDSLLQWSRGLGEDIVLSVKTEEEFQESRLFPEERLLLSEKAVLKRRKEFSLGRQAAHEAYSHLTRRHAVPVLRGPYREPLWPEGVIGSLSHSGPAAIAAVGWKKHYAGIGIDIEFITRTLSSDIACRVCDHTELDWVKSASDNAASQLRLHTVFSAKEAVFKAFFPMEYVMLDFFDAHLEWDEGLGKFRGQLFKSPGQHIQPGVRFAVNCHLTEHYVCTLVLLRNQYNGV
ncbi:4'-phosphopantetheinyl transferase family protein [Paenibacillus sp. TH7-28]